MIWENVPIIQMYYELNIAGISRRLKGDTARKDTYVSLWEASLE